jgi:anti-sigma regulatory factor (Ser/Thr protein kinase)
LEVPCSREAPLLVREALDRVEQIGPVREDARLIATELVTNAVLHSGCEAGHRIEVCARLTGDRLLISVDDPCIRGENAEIRSEPDSTSGGFGLRLVQKIARRWGWDRPNGHRVWAELSLRR